MFRRLLDDGALQQTDLNFVAEKMERLFSKRPKPRILKVGMKLSYYTEDNVTGEINFKKGNYISEIAVYYLKRASDCRRLREEPNINAITERVMEITGENDECFLCFCALDVSVDTYF